MALIKLYKDGVVGDTSGTLISSGDGTSPIDTGFIKILSTGEQVDDWIPICVRTDSGYKTILENSRHCRISIATSTNWQLALDTGSPMAYGASLDLTSEITAVNTLFYLRAKSLSTEVPINDSSVDIQLSATIGAV